MREAYTTEERAKICENTKAIILYLIEKSYALRYPVDIHFGEQETFCDGTTESRYHITINPNCTISGRIGNLGITFDESKKDTSYTTSVYSRTDYAVAMMKNWGLIKAHLFTAMQKQQEELNLINNFTV